jgi:hypothetical protein
VSSPPATTINDDAHKQAVLFVAQAFDHAFRAELALNATRSTADHLDEASLVAAALTAIGGAPNGAVVYDPAALPGKVQFNSDRSTLCLTLATSEPVPGTIAEGPCA